MFQKHKVAFTNKGIFGTKFRPTIDVCFCVVSKMLFLGKMNTDGTIDISNGKILSKTELWCYIYYLFYYNHMSIKIFESMKSDEDGKASADKFYEKVVGWSQSIKPVDNNVLVGFINKVLQGKEKITNPVFDYLQFLLSQKIDYKITGVNLITGKDKSGFEIVTDKKKVENANVKISILRD